jgi:hypothetical protein
MTVLTSVITHASGHRGEYRAAANGSSGSWALFERSPKPPVAGRIESRYDPERSLTMRHRLPFDPDVLGEETTVLDADSLDMAIELRATPMFVKACKKRRLPRHRIVEQ